MGGINLSILKDFIAGGNFQEVYDEFQKSREAIAASGNGGPTDPRVLLRDETNFWLGLVVAFRYLRQTTPELKQAMEDFDAGKIKRKVLFRITVKYFQDAVDNIERQCDVWFQKTQIERIRAASDAVNCDCETCQKNRAGLADLAARIESAKVRVLNPDPAGMPPI